MPGASRPRPTAAIRRATRKISRCPTGRTSRETTSGRSASPSRRPTARGRRTTRRPLAGTPPDHDKDTPPPPARLGPRHRRPAGRPARIRRPGRASGPPTRRGRLHRPRRRPTSPPPWGAPAHPRPPTIRSSSNAHDWPIPDNSIGRPTAATAVNQMRKPPTGPRPDQADAQDVPSQLPVVRPLVVRRSQTSPDNSTSTIPTHSRIGRRQAPATRCRKPTNKKWRILCVPISRTKFTE